MNNGFAIVPGSQCEILITLQSSENDFYSKRSCEFVCIPEERSEIEIVIDVNEMTKDPFIRRMRGSFF